MKLSVSLLSLVLCMGCNDNEPSAAEVSAATIESTIKNDNSSKATSDTSADLILPVKATLDMGDYTFRVHSIIQYHPSEKQAKMMVLDDSKKDFYILDCSLENKTDEPIAVKENCLAAYFSLSDANTHSYSMRGVSILAAFTRDNNQPYPQPPYVTIISKKLPASEQVRCNLYGVEVPEGATITGIGFYRSDKAKNKFTEISQ